MNEKMGILGRKIGMTQIYDEKGRVVPVTAIEAGPCVVMQVKNPGNDGYSAVQIGFLEKRPRAVPAELMKKAQGKRGEFDLLYGRIPQAARGHAFKAETTPKYFVRELRLPAEEASSYKPGQRVELGGVFEIGSWVDVVGTSKGRGFTGVIKRHGFTKFGNTHGTHMYRRHGGSIGCRKPQHTRKGTRMAGHSGHEQTTVQNLLVAGMVKESHTLLVRGAIPGPNGGFVVVRKALKK